MEQRIMKIFATQLRIAVCVLLFCLLTLLLLSFTTRKFADDLWAQLGISKSEGTSNISASFLDGYLNYYGARNARNIATGNRAQVVKDLAAYARQYVNSEAFKTAYRERRKSTKPEPPAKAKTEAEMRDEFKKNFQESIRSMEEMAKSTNPDLKKLAQENLPALRQQLKEAEDPKNPIMKMMADGEKMNYESNLEKYKKELAEYETNNPVDPKLMIRARLKEFLEATADIDFNAQLKERNGKMIFVNPVYEGKPADWKRAFRSGKEAVSAARSFAQEWLKELN